MLQRFRIFTLEQANSLLPLIEDLTRRTRDRLERLPETDQEATVEAEQDSAAQQARVILDEWARLVQELGAQPKGIFTVDFRSPDPNVLWCWAPGEQNICHRHYTWESFKDRVVIEPGKLTWPSSN